MEFSNLKNEKASDGDRQMDPDPNTETTVKLCEAIVAANPDSPEAAHAQQYLAQRKAADANKTSRNIDRTETFMLVKYLYCTLTLIFTVQEIANRHSGVSGDRSLSIGVVLLFVAWPVMGLPVLIDSVSKIGAGVRTLENIIILLICSVYYFLLIIK